MMAPVETFHTLLEAERALTQRLRARIGAPPGDPNAALDARHTLGERVADRVALLVGSWTFIGASCTLLFVWIGLNVWAATGAPDPYPFILLNLVLSTLAAVQAPVILMSQNRSADRDRAHADLDYRVNVRAEAEIAALKVEMEDLRGQQMGALLAIQYEQLTLLRRLSSHTLASEPVTDPRLPAPVRLAP
jgi:uncharacterized membrane protein